MPRFTCYNCWSLGNNKDLLLRDVGLGAAWLTISASVIKLLTAKSTHHFEEHQKDFGSPLKNSYRGTFFLTKWYIENTERWVRKTHLDSYLLGITSLLGTMRYWRLWAILWKDDFVTNTSNINCTDLGSQKVKKSRKNQKITKLPYC